LLLCPPAGGLRSTSLEHYQVEFEEEDVIRGALARELFVALRRVAKEFNLSFPMTSVQNVTASANA